MNNKQIIAYVIILKYINYYICRINYLKLNH